MGEERGTRVLAARTLCAGIELTLHAPDHVTGVNHPKIQNMSDSRTNFVLRAQVIAALK